VPDGCVFALPPFPKFGFRSLHAATTCGSICGRSLGGLLSLWRTCDNGLDAIHHDPSTHLGAIGNKARPRACHRDPGAGVPGHRLSWRRLSGLCQQPSNEKTN
jgi:hypothetical protein